ncbi:MBL fold metallo-hydrolase [Nanoarchaeota archaeon]
MKITVLGIGNAMSTENYCTSFFIENGNRSLMIDCPPGLFRILDNLAIDKQIVNNILITHCHGDHIGGLEPLCLWKKFIENKKVNIYTTKQIYKVIKDHWFAKMDKSFNSDFTKIVNLKVEDFIDFHEIKIGENFICDLKVETRKNWHYHPTIGLRITDKNGAVFGYSGDTIYRKPLIEKLFSKKIISKKEKDDLLGFIWNADIIFHDAENIQDGIHTYVGDLEKLSEKVRKKMYLIHVPDSFKSEKIKVAEQGKSYRI